MHKLRAALVETALCLCSHRILALVRRPAVERDPARHPLRRIAGVGAEAGEAEQVAAVAAEPERQGLALDVAGRHPQGAVDEFLARPVLSLIHI